jgi:hypothetical protein
MDTTIPPLASIGIDIGKEVFHIVGLIGTGEALEPGAILGHGLTATCRPPLAVFRKFRYRLTGHSPHREFLLTRHSFE